MVLKSAREENTKDSTKSLTWFLRKGKSEHRIDSAEQGELLCIRCHVELQLFWTTGMYNHHNKRKMTNHRKTQNQDN